MRQSGVRTIRSRPDGGATQLGMDSAGRWNNQLHSRIARQDRSRSALDPEDAPFKWCVLPVAAKARILIPSSFGL